MNTAEDKRRRKRKRNEPPQYYLRRIEIIVIARRKGVADTEDIARFLIVWFWHRPPSADEDPIGSLIHIAWQMGRDNYTATEAREIIAASKRGKPLYHPDAIGEYLRLTDAERTAWGIRTIGGYDFSKRQRTVRRKQQARDRQARHRQKQGARPHSQSLSRTEPWKLEGKSRRTWERHRKQREAAE